MKNVNIVTLASVLLLAGQAQAGNTEMDSNANISSGDGNTLIGTDAGRSTIDENDNTFVGWQAGYYNRADDNVFVGAQAGYTNFLGTRNSFVGVRAGYGNVNGDDNTFFGTEAGYSNTSGSRNTFLGEESGHDTTEGDDNTFAGEDAGKYNVTGYRNTAVGNDALYGGTSPGATNNSWGNTVFGRDAGEDVDGGIRNTFIGSMAGVDVGGGNFNTFFGARTGEHTEHGNYNTFVGVLAGRDNNRTNQYDTSDRNTYLGVGSGSILREGSDNVVLGAFADFVAWTDSDADIESGFADGWGTSSGMPTLGDLGQGSSYNISRATIVGAAAVGSVSDVLVVGYNAEATLRAEGSIAIGTNTYVNHSNAVVIGDNASSHADNTVILGNDSTVSWEPYVDATTALGSSDYRFSDAVTETLTTLAADDSAASWTLAADNGADNGDSWQISAADNGDLSFNNNLDGSFVAKLTLANSGDIELAGDITLASDERLKTAIEPLTNGLQLIRLLEGKRYRWKPELHRDNDVHLGFIAQQIEAVVPELVLDNAEGIKSVNYVEVTPLLVNALQQLGAESDAIDAELSALNAEIEQLAQQVGL